MLSSVHRAKPSQATPFSNQGQSVDSTRAYGASQQETAAICEHEGRCDGEPWAGVGARADGGLQRCTSRGLLAVQQQQACTTQEANAGEAAPCACLHSQHDCCVAAQREAPLLPAERSAHQSTAVRSRQAGREVASNVTPGPLHGCGTHQVPLRWRHKLAPNTAASAASAASITLERTTCATYQPCDSNRVGCGGCSRREHSTAGEE